MKKYKKYFLLLGILIVFCVSVCFIPIDATRFIPILEKQVEKDLGVKIHIDRLIFRFGPSLKIKAPDMYVMYNDGQKFAQFNNVKFFVPWSTLVNDDITVKKIYSDKFQMRISSEDKYLSDIVKKIQNRKFKSNPNLTLKEYNISYVDYKATNVARNYKISGSKLELIKLLNHRNFKLETIGNFSIDDKQHISYDIVLLPEFDLSEQKINMSDLSNAVEQINDLDFCSDIMADLSISKKDDLDMQVSGVVNVDNISVLDPLKKEPKSFIYLTFMGSKTKVFSNIYATGDKKVYIDGIVNNSKNPEIDLKVKTDAIRIADIYKKLKIIANCSNLRDVDSIDGNIKADFNIKGDMNKMKSSGYMKVSDASIKAGSLDIQKINSDVDFSNNVVNISKAEGYVGKAPIFLKGKIDKKFDLELIMDKVELKHLFKGDLGIKSGVMSLVASLNGNFDNLIHKENLQIDKFSVEKSNCNISFTKLKLDTNKENTAYISNLQLKPNISELIKLPLLKLNIDADSIKIPDANIYMPNSKLTLRADVSSYNTDNALFNVNLEGFINSRDINALKTKLSVYPLKLRISGNKDLQNIESQIVFEKAEILDEPSILNFVSKLDCGVLKIEDLSVLPFNGKFSSDLKSNVKGTKYVTISGIVENLKEPLLKNIRIFVPQFVNLTYMDTVAQLKGDIFVNGKYNHPEIIGQINVQNLINHYLQMSVNNATVDFNKNVAVFSAPTVRLSDSSLGLNGTLSTNFTSGLLVKGLNVKSKFINTDTLLMYKDNPIFKTSGLKINEGKFYSEKAVLTVYGTPLYLSAINSDFTLANNLVSAKNISAELFNGKMAGSLEFNLRDEDFKTSMQARGVSANPIFDVVSSKKDTVSGIMDFDTNITGNISSKKSLNGDIKFIVHNGRMGTLGKLEHLLYAQNVIADNMLRTSLSVVTKAITLKDTGLFKYLRGEIQMSDGVANIKTLQSQGPLMSLYIKGQYNPINDYAKLVVLGRLSDEIISGLGAFGDFSMNKLLIMLTGEDNKSQVLTEDFEKLPQLPVKNTKEFRSIINGVLEKPSSVIQFNWISYSQKSYRQKDVPMGDTKIPDFVENLPY